MIKKFVYKAALLAVLAAILPLTGCEEMNADDVLQQVEQRQTQAWPLFW